MANKKSDRIRAVKAMEFLARQINAENIFMYWLADGVADSDIRYGDLLPTDGDDLEYYLEDEHFADLMALFLRLMSMAFKDGGLYCDGVVSSDLYDPPETFGVVRWEEDDIRDKLEDMGVIPEPELVAKVKRRMKHHMAFRDLMIEHGWIIMEGIINDVLKEK